MSIFMLRSLLSTHPSFHSIYLARHFQHHLIDSNNNLNQNIINNFRFTIKARKMVVTNEVSLPDFPTLTTQEVNLSTAALMTAAPFLGKQCEGINTEFMLCRQETGDARACVELGKKVTYCAMQVFKGIKKNCLEEFNQYLQCIDKSSGDYGYRHCRKTQGVFDNCMDDKLCVKRPDFGYFCRGRVHKTNSKPPPPPPCPCYPKVPDATPSLPDCKERKPPRFGGRLFWVTE